MSITTRYLGFTNGVQRLVWAGPTGTVTAHMWGGGGGRGGNDSYSGGNGTGGGYSNYNFSINDGDVLDIAVGGPGGNGQGGPGGPGGVAGSSYSLLLFNTRTTPASPAVFSASNPSWGSFLNTYGVWESVAGATNFSRTYTVNFPTSSSYTFTFSADNYGTVYLDGSPVISLSGSSPANYQLAYQATINVSSGNHTISIQANNTGGPGGVALAISATQGFSGGRGGRAGYSGSSGGGGGGGGASVLFLNNTVLSIAAGGGGGGGGGNYGYGQNAPGTRGQAALGVYAGQNGEDKSGDGGGGGGGGGGLHGGNGGSTSGGDVGGLAGSYGLSTSPGENPSNTTPGGTSSLYYKTGIAQGATSVQPSTSGYVAIVFEASGVNINFNGQYGSAQKTYIKNSGVWKEIQTIWINSNGVWRPVDGGLAPVFGVIPDTIGVNSRPYS